MDDDAPPALRALDSPLPAEVAGSGHGWLTAYRRFPVFSRPWARGRLRLFGGAVLVGLGLALVPLLLAPDTDRPYGGLVQLLLQLGVPLLVGPWLARRVRLRGWPPLRESLLVASALLAVVAGLQAFHAWGAEPMKQWIAERAGQVDENGKRKRIMVSLGLTLSTPDDGRRDSASSAPAPDSDQTRLTTALTSALLSFWFAGGAGLWGLHRERVGLAALAQARALARAQAQRREAEMRLSVLAAQVEPHFLFNTLAGVRSAIATDPARASDMIDRLVDYLRASIPRLRSSGGSASTLGGQIEIVRAYLGLMSARMPRLQFTIQAAPELLALPCPPLMLISLAENAVKHGVEPKIGPAHIALLARRDEAGALEITVADDGAGFGASASGSGLGLANIRERLQQMFGGRAALTLKARPEGGVAATLTLPTD